MKPCFTTFLIGGLILAVATPVTAAPPPEAVTQQASDRDGYVHQVQTRMQEWRRKLYGFSEIAEAKREEAGTIADDDLNQAWTKAEAASRKLQSASGDNWDSAKTAFEAAAHDLAVSWQKIHPAENPLNDK